MSDTFNPNYPSLPEYVDQLGDRVKKLENEPTSGTNVIVGGASQKEVRFNSDPQGQITNIKEAAQSNINSIKDIYNKINDLPKYDVVVLEAGTDLNTFDFMSYQHGTWFRGHGLIGVPPEVTESTEVMIQLIKYGDVNRFAIELYHTGLYEDNTGVFINFHYADKFEGWQSLSGGGGGGGSEWKIANLVKTGTFLPTYLPGKNVTFDTSSLNINEIHKVIITISKGVEYNTCSWELSSKDQRPDQDAFNSSLKFIGYNNEFKTYVKFDYRTVNSINVRLVLASGASEYTYDRVALRIEYK